MACVGLRLGHFWGGLAWGRGKSPEPVRKWRFVWLLQQFSCRWLSSVLRKGYPSLIHGPLLASPGAALSPCSASRLSLFPASFRSRESSVP